MGNVTGILILFFFSSVLLMTVAEDTRPKVGRTVFAAVSGAGNQHGHAQSGGNSTHHHCHWYIVRLGAGWNYGLFCEGRWNQIRSLCGKESHQACDDWILRTEECDRSVEAAGQWVSGTQTEHLPFDTGDYQARGEEQWGGTAWNRRGHVDCEGSA